MAKNYFMDDLWITGGKAWRSLWGKNMIERETNDHGGVDEETWRKKSGEQQRPDELMEGFWERINGMD